jgi:hypothetical protein
LESFSLKWFLLQECLDSILLFEQEEVVVVNVEGLSYNIEILSYCFGDRIFGFKHDLVILLNVPQPRAIRILKSSLRPWDVGALLNDFVDHFD